MDNDATHSFVSERMTWGLHCKVECDSTSLKEVNLGVKPMSGVIRSSPLTVGSLLGVLGMKMVHMDDHTVIFGQNFLRLAEVDLVPHEDCLLFVEEIKTFGVSFTMRKKFGQVPHTSSMTLFKFSRGDWPHIVVHLQEEAIPQQEDLGIILGVLRVDDWSVGLSMNLDIIVHLGNLFCALEK